MGIFSIADTFIKRPVLTTVCTIIIVLLGAICVPLLPVLNLPDIAPIQVQVTSAYIGADAETVENTVTTPLERQINGVENMQYLTSNSTNAGGSAISVFFNTDSNKDINQVNVQNRVAVVEPTLPDAVKQTGVAVKAASTSILLVYGVNSDADPETGKDRYDTVFLSNYLDLFVTDELKRVKGVGDITIFGERKYAMRLWLDPNALASRQLTATDVSSALRSQNIQVGAGTLGSQPAPADQPYTFPVRIQGRLRDEREFGELVLKTQPDGTLVKLKDIGRVELGAENYDSSALVNGKDGVGIGVYQQPGSNALDVAEAIKERMQELEQDFPPGLNAFLIYDVTKFIESSQEEVFHTLIEAIVLVVLVIFIFLQDWRTTIIPAIAIPVSLIGTMAFALAFNFSINSLTMFALVLATGLVVDDGIVVVEAIAVKLEEGMAPRQAAFEAMRELTGAVIGTSLVLMAVFVPVSFFPGATGIMYKQFALIIVFSILISTFNALSFSPSLSAILLKRHEGEGRGPLAWFFRKFNQGFDRILGQYRRLLEFLIRMRMIVVGLFVLGLGLTYLVFTSVPNGFIPDEDQGVLIGIVQSSDGVALNTTQRVGQAIYSTIKDIPEVDGSFIISGSGFNGVGPNQGLFYLSLKPWDERPEKDQSASALLGRLNQEFAKNQTAFIQVFNPPAVPGFGATGGFQMQLQDKTNGRLSIDEFLQAANDIIAQLRQQPAVSRPFTQFTSSTPQFQVEIDRDRLNAQNVDFAQAVQTVSAYIGSNYVNDFTYGQRSYRVYVQADQGFRNSPDDLDQINVRSRDGKLVRLSQIATVTPITGPSIISHFNIYRTIAIQGNTAPGYSTGQTIQAVDRAFKAANIPGLGYEWTGLTREQVNSGGQAGLIFGLGIVAVFLVLAAQYENYIDPIIILLTVPFAILGAMMLISLRGLSNDLYCQIALVMLIGLAAKNAILIVEFANQAREQGMSIAQAAMHAAQERFRPILMTALSALVGFWPLVAASGAGAASRWSLGTAVFGGLLLATIVNYLLTPVLYVVIKSLADRIFGDGKRPPKSPAARGTDAKTDAQDGAKVLEPQSTQRIQGSDTPA
jgi:HAE1 family hydrophobic/amphiphilic exporter-1